jgi:hypothetical protein
VVQVTVPVTIIVIATISIITSFTSPAVPAAH